MDCLQLLETKPPFCCSCGNPFNLTFWCRNWHYVCSLCQITYESKCPICAESYYSPQESNDNLLKTLLEPDNSAFDVNYDLNCKNGPMSLTMVKRGLKKKSPLEKCKEHFFLAVWDALTAAVFFGLSSKRQGKRRKSTTTIAGSISKILSRVTRKMGKSVYDSVLTRYQDKKTFQISLGIFMLLIGGQFILQRIQKG